MQDLEVSRDDKVFVNLPKKFFYSTSALIFMEIKQRVKQVVRLIIIKYFPIITQFFVVFELYGFKIVWFCAAISQPYMMVNIVPRSLV